MCLIPDLLFTLVIWLPRVMCNESTTYRPIADSSRICLATYSEWLDNKLLLGTWYNVYNFAEKANLPDAEECREILFKRPSQEELVVYKNTYNLTGMPYTLGEDSIVYKDMRKELFTGLLIGRRQAKFFLPLPLQRSVFPDRYSVIVLRYINENYIVYEDCMLRGNSKWLMSKIKYPTDEELQRIIDSQSDLKAMENQKFCALNSGLYD